MRLLACLASLAVLLGAAAWPALAQSYATLAAQPDPRDFVGRAETHLTLLGNPMRFVGYDIGRLGYRPDGSPPASPPDLFELQDALATAQALGASVLRAGPALGKLAQLDLLLKTARDMGLKVIVPLAGAADDCSARPDEGICTYVRRRGRSDTAAFFTDPGLRADFLAGVADVLNHVNTLTGTAYRNDPTILAWEDCLGCGAAADAASVGSWTEQLGRTVKAADPHHLFATGASSGRIGPAASRPTQAAAFAAPSVDIVGDSLATGQDPAAARSRLAAAADTVEAAGKVYVMDSVGWTPAIWKTADDLQAWLSVMAKQRKLSGALIGWLEGHAAGGGYLPAPPAAPAEGVAALYFPGIATADLTQAEMQARGRALRRFAYAMYDIVMPPAYLLPPKPEIISAAHGHVTWRGAAGAGSYTIERSPDPSAPGTWQLVCDACATDLTGGWQDPAPPGSGAAWYRVMPFNINGHKSVPSDAFQTSR